MDILARMPEPVLESVALLQIDLDSWGKNPRIGSVLNQTVLVGGKRLRPLLTMLFGQAFDLKLESLAPFARAVELVHASTLAHDDVIDNADHRRGKPSINIVSSNKRAVLAGDYLLAYVLEEVAKQGRNDIVVELARVIGDLAEGEWVQLENAQNNALTWQHVTDAASKKTGSVLRWCSIVPALLAEAPENVVNSARNFGEKLGIAFQLTDDILDIVRRDGSELADQKSGVISSIIFQQYASAENEVVNAPDALSKVANVNNFEQAIAKVRACAAQLIAEAEAELDVVSNYIEPTAYEGQIDAIEALRALATYILERV